MVVERDCLENSEMINPDEEEEFLKKRNDVILIFDKKYIEHDTYFVFNKLMAHVDKM